MSLSELIKRIPDMDDREVIEMLNHNNVLARTRAIWEVSTRRLHNDEVKSKLQDMKNDHAKFWENILVCDFAVAALDVLGYEKYQGTDEMIKRLICTDVLNP